MTRETQNTSLTIVGYDASTGKQSSAVPVSDTGLRSFYGLNYDSELSRFVCILFKNETTAVYTMDSATGIYEYVTDLVGTNPNPNPNNSKP